MNFKEALIEVNTKQNLIGQNYQGAILDEIIIAPSEPYSFEKFKCLYLEGMNAQQAITPFLNEDVMILGIYNKDKIKKNGIFLFKEL